MSHISQRTSETQRKGTCHFDPKPADRWLDLLQGRIKIVGDCWIVDGNEREYARLFSRVDGQQQAHRLVYAWLHPDENINDMHIHHECERPGCINPAHLTAMTPSDHSAHHAHRRRVA